MTDTTNTTDTPDRSMHNVSHTNPYTGETVGQLFSRGPTVVTDGGERAATDPDNVNTMEDVDHTPPHDADDANDVFERGSEHDTREDVGDEE